MARPRKDPSQPSEFNTSRLEEYAHLHQTIEPPTVMAIATKMNISPKTVRLYTAKLKKAIGPELTKELRELTHSKTVASGEQKMRLQALVKLHSPLNKKPDAALPVVPPVIPPLATTEEKSPEDLQSTPTSATDKNVTRITQQQRRKAQ